MDSRPWWHRDLGAALKFFGMVFKGVGIVTGVAVGPCALLFSVAGGVWSFLGVIAFYVVAIGGGHWMIQTGKRLREETDFGLDRRRDRE